VAEGGDVFEFVDEGADDVSESATASKKPRKKKAKTTQRLSHEQYREVCLAVVSHLRRNINVETNGESIGALVNWRLGSMRNELTSSAEVRAQEVLFRAILTNMIKKDSTLLLVSAAPDQPDNSVVVVHPNFTADQ
jgi:hypothetical protein